MDKRKFFICYGILALVMVLLSGSHYFSGGKSFWWLACMLSAFISLTYCYFWLRKKITEEGFVNYIVSIFLITSFLISFGLSIYQSGQENLPIILCAANAVLWIFYSAFLVKKLA